MKYTTKCPELFEALAELVIRTAEKETISEKELYSLPKIIFVLSKLIDIMSDGGKNEEKCDKLVDTLTKLATTIANKETTSETELKILPEVVDALITMMNTLRISSMTGPHVF